MTEIKIFENAEFGKIRVVMNGDEPMFCLADVCKVLELSNPTIVAQRLEDDERTKLGLGRQVGATKSRLNEKGISLINTLTNGGNKNIVYVNEQNLYKVIMRSDKPQAESFQDWLFDEVLPAIRKTVSLN